MGKYQKSCCQQAFEEGHAIGAVHGIKLRVLKIASKLISNTSLTDAEIAEVLELNKDIVIELRSRHGGNKIIDLEEFYEEIERKI